MTNLPLLRRLFDIGEIVRTAGFPPTETTLDAIIYLLQEVFHMDLGCRFQLYGSSPWSDDLRNHLGALQSYGYIAYHAAPGDREAHFVPGPFVASLLHHSEPLSWEARNQLAAVLPHLAQSPRLSCSTVATAVYYLHKGNAAGAFDSRTGRILGLSREDVDLALRRAQCLVDAGRQYDGYWLDSGMASTTH